MTENEKTELFDKWYDENYDEWAEGEEGIALREELEQAFKGGIAELENKIADIKANCDLAIEGRDVKIKELEQQIEKMKEEHKQDILDLVLSNSSERAELEKENAELKEQNRNYEQLIDKGSVTLVKERLKNHKKLTKAKDFIENIIRVTWGEGWNYSLDWKVKAEQFIKEIEK